jgi:hypothetical protein
MQDPLLTSKVPVHKRWIETAITQANGVAEIDF